MNKRSKWISIILVMALFGLLLFLPQTARLRSAAFWKQQTNPGALSASHAFLQENCAGCHTAFSGVKASNCVACHANHTALLQKQPSAFHAHITTCTECHIEHQGAERRPTEMDHLALARLGIRELREDSADGERNEAQTRIQTWIGRSTVRDENVSISAAEAVLDCASCHSNQDKHRTFFSSDCAQCHGTAQWSIAEFQHPSPRSASCSQCHQAPPSHYMMHFEMVDKKVAAKANGPGNPCCEDVRVNQCYRCHQTNAWNDIKGVGWYKHH